jgi:hypothetical protein
MLTDYTIALFVHVSAAIGFFVGTSLWLFSLAALRRAQRVEQARTLLALISRAGPVSGISGLLILITGIYMTVTAWKTQNGWIGIALIALLLMIPLGAGLIEPRRRALARLANETTDGPLPAAFEARARDPLLGIALAAQTGLLIGIVFLMTTKPSLMVSVIASMIALALGAASGALFSGRRRTRAPEAATPAQRA